MGDIIRKPFQAVQETLIAPGAAKKERLQKRAVEKQRQIEQARLAEAESEVASRRARATRPGGRSLLIATSPRGVQTLGGS